MSQTAPIPYADIKEVHAKAPLQDVQLPLPQVQDISPLHELTSTDRLFITRRLRVKNVLLLRGRKYKFLIQTPDENVIYTVEEDNSWWAGYLCYGLRPMQLLVRNRSGEEVMRINRPYACTPRVLPCQMQTLQVFSPPGTRIGSIEQQWAPVRPAYIVNGANGEQIFWIQGPRITLSFFSDVQFQASRMDGRPAGSTGKRWEGITQSLFFSPITDRFGVAFERDLSVQEKALLLAASILFDYMYYDI